MKYERSGRKTEFFAFVQMVCVNIPRPDTCFIIYVIY